MGWYDVFARFYDASLEELYADARVSAAEALDLSGARRVLDVPVGTGQSLSPLLARAGESATVVGVDLSPGMLAVAGRRRRACGWGERVQLERSDVHDLDVGSYDRLHVFLGLTTFARHEAAFERLWAGLAPGGRAVLVDVYAERPGLQGKVVSAVARADLTRRAWEPLERVAEGFSRVSLPSNPRYGGELWLAAGTKPL